MQSGCGSGVIWSLHVQIVSEAAMRLPEEVYRADGKGAPRAEGELTHEERRRRRAQHKRAFKAKSQQQVQLRSQSQGRRVACLVLMSIHSFSLLLLLAASELSHPLHNLHVQ